jgi:hypothetical protein
MTLQNNFPNTLGSSTSMKNFSIFLRPLVLTVTTVATGFAILQSAPAKAVTVGDQITGSLSFGGGSTNYFNPSNGGVPSGQGYLNAPDKFNSNVVPLSDTSTEFGYSDAANTDTADFISAGLILKDVSQSNGSSTAYSFVSNGFVGSTLNLVSSNFSGVTYSLAGDTITINAPAFSSAGTYSANFRFSPVTASVPEPFTVIGSLVGGIAAFCMKKKLKASAN